MMYFPPLKGWAERSRPGRDLFGTQCMNSGWRNNVKHRFCASFCEGLVALGLFYFSSGAQAIPVPPMKELAIHGERYEAEVPDTLDLAERAQLAFEPLMAWAEDRKLYPEGSASPLTPNRGVLGPKYMEAFPMIRVMSGYDKQ